MTTRRRAALHKGQTAEAVLIEGHSLNDRVAPLVAELHKSAGALRIRVGAGPLGETVVDAGLSARGSLAAGLIVAEIAMGGLGRVSLVPGGSASILSWTVTVQSSQPVLACLGSQLAGWHLADEHGFRGLGSGPARALAAREKVFAEIGYDDKAATGTLLVECDRPPPPGLVSSIADACGLHPSQLTLILVPTPSLAGGVQVAARVLETAVGKARHAGFSLEAIIDGFGSSPLAPPHPDPAESMGRTNDAMIYGGTVHLYVTGSASDARALAAQLPSSASAQHGRFFAEILAEAGGDFYGIDPLLFGPAVARVTALDSGETFAAGRLEPERVSRSFARRG